MEEWNGKFACPNCGVKFNYIPLSSCPAWRGSLFTLLVDKLVNKPLRLNNLKENISGRYCGTVGLSCI